MKLQKRKGGGYIYMPTSDVEIAKNWFKALPDDLVDKADYELYDTLTAFLKGADI